MSRKIVRPTGIPSPGSFQNLTGGTIARRYQAASVLRRQDTALWVGARIVGRVGAGGAGEWRVPSTDPALSPTRTHPAQTLEAVAAVWKVRLTPGYQIVATVMAQPSGGQQQPVGGGGFETADVPAGGSVQVTAYYDNNLGDTETVTAEVTPPISEETYYGESSDEWADIFGPIRVDLRIAEALEDPAEAEKWCGDEVDVTVTVTYIGAVRVMDVTAFEAMTGYVRDWTDTDYVAHAFTDGSGHPLKAYPSAYPIQRREEATPDPTGGSLQALSVALAQQMRLGPVLASWGAWEEDEATVTTTTPTGWTTSNTNLEDMHTDGNATAYAEANPGWSMSSGSNARGFNLSGDIHELRDVDGVVPVRLRVYAKNSGGVGNQATVMVQTSEASCVSVQITTTSLGWSEACGELRCGIGAEDFSSLQLLGKVSGGAYELEIVGFVVEFDGTR